MCREAHPFVVYYICIDLNYDFIYCQRAVNVFIILELRLTPVPLRKVAGAFLFPEVFLYLHCVTSFWKRETLTVRHRTTSLWPDASSYTVPSRVVCLMATLYPFPGYVTQRVAEPFPFPSLYIIVCRSNTH